MQKQYQKNNEVIMTGKKNTQISFWCTENDEQLLKAVAERLHRSKASALRWLIYRAAEETGVEMTTPTFTQINLIK